MSVDMMCIALDQWFPNCVSRKIFKNKMDKWLNKSTQVNEEEKPKTSNTKRRKVVRKYD
jgi:Fe-S cluster biosynthesis and repair protein YggX